VKKILFAIALFCPSATWAQDIKPFDAKVGLWESTASTEIGGMPAMPAMPAIPQETLDKMPPAQRAQIEAMMKGRGAGSPQTSTTRFCLDKDSLRRAFYSSDKSCTTRLVSSTAATQQIHVECNGSTKGAGDLTLERVDAEHIKGAMVMRSTGDARSGGAGRSMDMKVTFSNKWISADCGDVKPIGEMGAK
jgi:hypothetical protein